VSSSYHLIHIVSGQEYKTPLVASQVFDRAQEQANEPGPDRPRSVSVWIISSLGALFDKKAQSYLQELRNRCPSLTIKMFGGVSRAAHFPLLQLMILARLRLGRSVVYHCRGEHNFEWVAKLRRYFPSDRIVLDIRGYWPIERLINKNIFSLDHLSDSDKKQYDIDESRLARAVSISDRVTTVSEPLRRYLIDHVGADKNTIVVPCCVKGVGDINSRAEIRSALGLGNNISILYLGGTQAYQHLEDLVIPYVKSALSGSSKCIGVFITQHKEKMELLCKDMDKERIRILSVPQQEVAKYLCAMDLGLLLRAPSIANSFSQPVKLGEYLGAGLPVIVEKGTGDVPEILREFNIGYTVSLSSAQSAEEFHQEVAASLNWYEHHAAEARNNAREFVKQHYTWSANVPKEREMYLAALKNNRK
jgi:glycosyltransferase involved in cell wall biosynthesis